jgi:hypothetical protein
MAAEREAQKIEDINESEVEICSGAASANEFEIAAVVMEMFMIFSFLGLLHPPPALG